MKRGIARTGVLLPIALLGITITPAAVLKTTLQELTSGSALIVLGKVKEVREIAGVRVALLSVEETWKGAEASEVSYLAQSTWTCDTSGAVPEERVLLFLVRYEFDPDPDPDPDPTPTDFQQLSLKLKERLKLKEPLGFRDGVEELGVSTPFMAIYWSGRGRMPVRVVDGEDYVTLYVDDVRLPSKVATIDGPEEEYASFLRSARLASLRRLISKWVRKSN